ncbi:MAG: c-type cytochrome [Acidobacteriota bacterium]|nr:c-type cytochrome [Acidobacteriota bacterium]
MLSKILLGGLAAGAILVALASSPAETAAAAHGKELFERRCSGCHAADIDKEGPRLRGVYGRRAAGGAGFSYSDSLKKLNVRWDDASLDKWLISPDAMAPDTDMSFRLADAAERKAVIAYLKSLGGQ